MNANDVKETSLSETIGFLLSIFVKDFLLKYLPSFMVMLNKIFEVWCIKASEFLMLDDECKNC